MKRVIDHPEGGRLLKELNPSFVAPEKNFLRMTYEDAIKYLKENNITKEDGTFYEFGEVSLFKPICNVVNHLFLRIFPKLLRGK